MVDEKQKFEVPETTHEIPLPYGYDEAARCRNIVIDNSDAYLNVTLDKDTGDFVVTAWNPACVKLFGISEADALGKKLSKLLWPSQHEKEDWHHKMIESVYNGEPGRQQMLNRPDGKTRRVRYETPRGRVFYLNIELLVQDLKCKESEDCIREIAARIIDETHIVDTEKELDKKNKELADQNQKQIAVNEQLKLDKGKTQRHLIFALLTVIVFTLLLYASLIYLKVEQGSIGVITSVVQVLLTILVMSYSFYFKKENPDTQEQQKAA